VPENPRLLSLGINSNNFAFLITYFLTPKNQGKKLVKERQMDVIKRMRKDERRARAHQAGVRQAYQPKRPFKTVEGVGSEAWKKLDIGAAGLLMEFYSKFDGFNRSNLSVTYSEVKTKMSSLIFTRWIWQRIGYGFLEVKRWGSLERKCSIYGLTDRWRTLSEHPDKLEKIKSMLNEIELLKRQPRRLGKLDEIRVLRHAIVRM